MGVCLSVLLKLRKKESKNMDGVDLSLTLSQKQSVEHSGETLMYDLKTAAYLNAT